MNSDVGLAVDSPHSPALASLVEWSADLRAAAAEPQAVTSSDPGRSESKAAPASPQATRFVLPERQPGLAAPVADAMAEGQHKTRQPPLVRHRHRPVQRRAPKRRQSPQHSLNSKRPEPEPEPQPEPEPEPEPEPNSDLCRHLSTRRSPSGSRQTSPPELPRDLAGPKQPAADVQPQLAFTSYHSALEVSAGASRVSMRREPATGGGRTALCAAPSAVMANGVHFAEFTLHSFLPDNLSPLMLGVARHTFDPRAQQSAARTSSGWSYEATTGKLLHDDRWYGWPGQVRAQPGERIGLLLDLTAGSLTLYREGRLQGVLVSSGLAGLGPLCWSAELWGGGQELEVAQSEPPRSIVEL